MNRRRARLTLQLSQAAPRGAGHGFGRRPDLSEQDLCHHALVFVI